MPMNMHLTKFVAAAKDARPRVLLTAVALAVVAPITVQRDPVIVLPLVLILGAIVLFLIVGHPRR
jgi:hypothetical protein